MRVLVACEESQAVCMAFRQKGHEAYSCDIDDCSGPHPEWHIKADVLSVLDQDWDLMIAHPPCTRLTNAGVRWLDIGANGKTAVQLWKDLFADAEFYCKLRDAPIPKKCIENPIMHQYARQLVNPGPRQVVQPWMFGEKMFKATGFEIYGLPNLEEKPEISLRHIIPKKGTEEHKEWSWVHRMPPGPERARLRSKTPIGIAKAMAEQWG